MNDIDKSHFLFPIKKPFRAEQLAKNLIQFTKNIKILHQQNIKSFIYKKYKNPSSTKYKIFHLQLKTNTDSPLFIMNSFV
jgi:hypothetical protein